MPGRKILRNAAKCLRCDDEIESEYRHDFKWCSCRSIFVDGGFDYIRRGISEGVSLDEVKDLSEFTEEKNDVLTECGEYGLEA